MPHEMHHRVRVHFVCNCHGKTYELCRPIQRNTAPSLRCAEEAPAGYTQGSGLQSCTLPPDLDARVERELRDNMQECMRRGFVLIEG
jgi:hypothetical protein